MGIMVIPILSLIQFNFFGEFGAFYYHNKKLFFFKWFYKYMFYKNIYYPCMYKIN